MLTVWFCIAGKEAQLLLSTRSVTTKSSHLLSFHSHSGAFFSYSHKLPESVSYYTIPGHDGESSASARALETDRQTTDGTVTKRAEYCVIVS